MKVLNSIEKNWINFHIQNQALIACVIKVSDPQTFGPIIPLSARGPSNGRIIQRCQNIERFVFIALIALSIAISIVYGLHSTF